MRLPGLARLTLLPVALLVGGCPTYYYGPPNPGYPGYGYGNIAVSWTFAGNTCAQTPAVVSVVVSVPNDPLPIYPNTFPCSVGTLPGQLVIYNYAAGNYTVNLTALDSNRNTIWTGSGTVTVVANQTNSVAINMQPAGSGGNSVAYLSWGFAPGVGSYSPPCTGLGDTDPDRMDSVALYVDGASSAAQTYDCTAGLGANQVTTGSLDAGQHTFQLVAYQSGLSYGFAETQPVTVTVSGNPTAQNFTFGWLVGGIGVAWTYPSQSACTSGGVDSVTIGFSSTTSSGYTVSGWPCNTSVAPFKRLPTAADAGVSYSLNVEALGAPPSPVLYSGTAAAITIQPGVFYDGTSATVVDVTLH